MADIYLLPISVAEELPEGFAEEHFPKRAEKAKRFLRREDLLRSYAAGALVACVPGAREDDLRFGPEGKPFLENGPCFSLSHSGEYALLAVDSLAIGADIETMAPIRQRESIAKRVFTPEEQTWMAASPDTRFYTLWTMKEAVMKLDGRGFTLAPGSFSVMPLLTGGTIKTAPGTAFGRTELSVPGYAVSVCGLNPPGDEPIKILTLKELLAMSPTAPPASM